MIQLIVACSKNMGIGKSGVLPWHNSEELAIFREKTKNSILIVGRRTAGTLPHLKDRIVLYLSRRRESIQDMNNALKCSSMDIALEASRENGKPVFIAGGAEVYREALQRDIVDKIHISILKKGYDCDTFFQLDFTKWCIEEKIEKPDFTHYVLTKSNQGEKGYLETLQYVLQNGRLKKGRNGNVYSVFYRNISFDLREGFPLLTTKKMFFRGIVEELLFFLRGDTDSKILEDKGVNIWRKNTDRQFLDSNGFGDRKEGMMGPLYGFNWRFYGAEYDEETGKPIGEGLDQIKKVLEMIRNDSSSRRILLTDYNPLCAEKGVLYPCHSIIIQFYIENGYLDMFCYNRSQDIFLGTPFNIASSSLLLCIIAKLSGLTPRFMHMSMGDVHIYEPHVHCVKEQLSRTRYRLPVISIRDGIDLEKLTYEDFTLENYLSHPAIKAEMVA